MINGKSKKAKIENGLMKLVIVLLCFCFAVAARAQSGGTYQITQSVIAGGGSESAGGSYAVTGTLGQSIATRSPSGGGTFRLSGGFWAPQALPPTSASVSLKGRVVISGGNYMSRTRIILSDAISGMMRVARPNSFGYYSFDELEVGRFYVIRAECPSLIFTPPSYDIMLLEAVTEINFTGEEAPKFSVRFTPF